MAKAVKVRISAQDDFSSVGEAIRQKVKGISDQFIKMKKNAEGAGDRLKAIGRFAIDFGQKMKWVAAGVIAFAGAALIAASNYEKLGIQFEILTKNAQLGRKLLDELRMFSLSAGPFEYDEIMSTSKALLNYNIEAGKIVPTLKMLATVAAGTELPLATVAEAYGRMAKSGFAKSRSLLQLSRAGIAPILADLMSASTGRKITQADVMKGANKIPFAYVQEAMLIKAKQYGNLLERIDGTTGEIMGDTKLLGLIALAEFGKVLGEASGFRDVLKEINSWLIEMIPKIGAWAKEHPNIVKFGAAVAAMTVPITAVAFAIGAVSTALGVMATAGIAVSASMPWLFALGLAAIKVYQYWDHVKNMFQWVYEKIELVIKGADRLAKAFGFGFLAPETTFTPMQSPNVKGLQSSADISGRIDIGLQSGLTALLRAPRGSYLPKIGRAHV